MPTPTKGPRLGGSPAHQRLLLSNLATQLFEHGRITTTHAKAKALRPLAEKLITFARKGDIHSRRQVLTVVRDKDVVHHLFAEIGPRMANRPGGYTRIIKVGPRKGDNAPMAQISLVEEMNVAAHAEGVAKRAVKEAAVAAPATQPADIASDEALETQESTLDNAEVDLLAEDVQADEANADAADALAEATGTEVTEAAAEVAQAEALEAAIAVTPDEAPELPDSEIEAVAAADEAEAQAAAKDEDKPEA